VCVLPRIGPAVPACASFLHVFEQNFRRPFLAHDGGTSKDRRHVWHVNETYSARLDPLERAPATVAGDVIPQSYNIVRCVRQDNVRRPTTRRVMPCRFRMTPIRRTTSEIAVNLSTTNASANVCATIRANRAFDSASVYVQSARAVLKDRARKSSTERLACHHHGLVGGLQGRPSRRWRI
jgi:hypothetical protein